MGPRFPLLLTTGRILSQYNVGAQTRRTDNVIWHEEDRLEIHPHDAEQRGVHDGDWVKLVSRSGETTLRALITERLTPGILREVRDELGENHSTAHQFLVYLGHVVTGNSAEPTTLEAVLIKAVITAHSACIRRLRIAIVFDGAMP